MSILTSTNEESLIAMLEGLAPGSRLELRPSRYDADSAVPLIEVIEIDKNGKEYWRAGMMALDMHTEVWVGDAGLARDYR